ncbi:hypothetical protein GCM10027396_25950 [Insolitispirillum peregrinum]
MRDSPEANDTMRDGFACCRITFDRPCAKAVKNTEAESPEQPDHRLGAGEMAPGA